MDPKRPSVSPRWLAAGLALLLPAAARADVVFLATLNTANLAGSANTYGAGAPYAIDFFLANGGNPTNNNAVTINAINLGAGGSPGGTINATPGVAPGSSLTNGVTLSDVAGRLYTDFNQTFQPGGVLSFRVDMTTTKTGTAPDNFSFSILDASGNQLPTTDTIGSTFFNVDLVPDAGFSQVFQSTQAPTIGPPTLTGAASVPEPGVPAMCACGLAALAAVGLLRGRAV